MLYKRRHPAWELAIKKGADIAEVLHIFFTEAGDGQCAFLW